MIQKIRQWLIDTYNGLYVIVLKPHMPSYVAVAAVVAAMLFGIVWGYVIAPVQYYDGAPYQLSAGYRDEWVKGLATARLSGAYDDDAIIERLRLIEAPTATIQRLIALESPGTVMEAALNQLLQVADRAEPGVPAPRPAGLLSDALTFLLPIIVVIVLALIVSPVWRLLIRPNFVDPLIDRLRPKSAAELEERKRAKQERELMKVKREQEEALKRDAATVGATNPYGAPMIQKLSIYTKGRGYDDSFAIEDEDNNFYGECGATIAKQVNGELVAVECWLFDKEDFVRTLTRIYVAQGSLADPSVRAELEARVDNPVTDIVPLMPGSVITLETDLLLVQYKAADVKYGQGNTFIEGMTLQVSAWYKKGVGAAAPAPAVPVAMPATPVAYNPPPVQQAAPPPPSYAPPAQPAAPAFSPPPAYNAPPPLPFDNPPQRPPARPPAPPEDDPFGGTGDFTPIGN